MTTTTKNEIFRCIAEAITNRADYRCVIDFEDGKTMLVDFSACGDPFSDDMVCIYSLQDDMDEIAWGKFTEYADAVDFVFKFMDKNPGRIYVESY